MYCVWCVEFVYMHLGVTASILDIKITSNRVSVGIKGNPPFIDVTPLPCQPQNHLGCGGSNRGYSGYTGCDTIHESLHLGWPLYKPYYNI